ncbi:MAG: ATP-binding protein [Planctomycetes bacterium]|nr:ATP-binding protein [Planctomycetota bacterium]
MKTHWVAAFSSPATGGELPGLRRRVQARLDAEGASGPVVDRVGLLVSELAHNAAEAGCGDGRVHVVLRREPGGLHLSVECCGNRDFEQLAEGLALSVSKPAADAERGRGLWLVTEFSKDLRVERGRGGWVRLALVVREEAGE